MIQSQKIISYSQGVLSQSNKEIKVSDVATVNVMKLWVRKCYFSQIHEQGKNKLRGVRFSDITVNKQEIHTGGICQIYLNLGKLNVWKVN